MVGVSLSLGIAKDLNFGFAKIMSIHGGFPDVILAVCVPNAERL